MRLRRGNNIVIHGKNGVGAEFETASSRTPLPQPRSITSMIVNTSEAKAHFSQIIERAYHGETVVIAKSGTPLVDLVPHRPSRPRKLGLLAGKFSVPDDFSKERAEIAAMFYGEEK